MSTKKTVFVAGHFGFRSIGCEAGLATLVRQFRARDLEIHVVVASGPSDTAAAHGVEAVAWNDLAEIHRGIEAADLVVIGGGDLLSERQEADPETLLTDRQCGLSRYAGVALLASLYRKPMMLYGIGAGPLASLSGRKLTRMAAEAAHAITVRDQNVESPS